MIDNSIYQISQVRDGIWAIQEKSVRVFVIEGEGRSLIVDTGFGTGDIRKVAEGLTANPLQLINTHSDGDHIGCNGYFESTYMHPAEYARYWDKCKKEFDIEGYVCQPVPVWEGDVIDIGTFQFEVIHLPGHTMGCIALLEREKRFLIAGDSIQGHGHLHLWGEGRNAHSFLSSMKKLEAQYMDAIDVIYPSHDDRELPPEWISKLAADAEQMINGEVEGTTPDPASYPFPIKAQLFAFPECNLYFNPQQKITGVIRKPEGKFSIR